MTTKEEIARAYRNRIERCEDRAHRHQPTTINGNCDWCTRWKVELLVLGFDPDTGQPHSAR